MTRNPKEDPKLLEREYVFSPDNVSITGLADKYGLARSGVADKARIGEWYKKRLAYQRQIEHSVIEALGEKWAQQGVALREKILLVAEKTLDKYAEALDKGDIVPKPAEAALMAGVIRQSLADIEAAARPNALVIDGEAEEMDPERAAEVISLAREALKRGGVSLLEAGEAADDAPSPG